MTIEKTNLLIDGEDIATSSYLEVRDPGRVADVVGLLAQGDARHVDRSVQAAHRAFLDWRQTTPEHRAGLLLKAADVLAAEAASVIELMARESGMLVPINKAEIGMAASIVRDNAEMAPAFLRSKEVEDEASWVGVEKEAFGVVAAIVPWNAPVILTMRKLAPALACGNTIVIKPAPTAPLGISILLKKIAALFPPGVVNIVHGGVEVGRALVTHPLVRKISFTGGGAVAKDIMKSAADTIKSVQLELGGNDPAIVLQDADLKDAIPKIIGGAFRRSGQFCFAVKRIYVPEAMHRTFVDLFCAEVAKFKVGHPLDAGTTFGPMNNKGQFDFVSGLIERTRRSGAQVIELGSKVSPDRWDEGFYLMPTVVADASPDLDVVTVEQFGPVVPIVAYRNEDEVVAMANQTELGLGSSVWSTDFKKAVALARRIEAGMTFINQAGTSRLGQRNIPFGGVKQSGIGRESSEVGLAEYVEYHAINYHK
ncbi:MAG: Aldehyde Dehydrogenase [Rhizobium sp.]|nr:Aldehyde Dehydrogenase [Rhizobium sp.]